MNARALALLGLAVCFLFGCGGRSISDYKSTSETARKAIETSLAAWKEGKPLGTISGKPAIDTFDARWRSGAKLEEFSILGEVAGTEHTQFEVEMKFANKPKEKSEYLVVGIDPLLVFRKEDYQRATGM
ncbi:MAG: hypothetical protein U0930_21415 [Pirellulales bacterium]